ncbi:hypothetical protein D9756_010435 [Leucocoprinus leucothites]|uniref:Nephrocystin 3-like N-terminal domain-containing protein n=1 Tax=Leucocoprinus leucothites TaxID=201217 RepID=A0A8H5FS59_9AGAR|nr:hypothetical protein D9756_010435 [Leucoagaricus leucothites]
MISNAHDFVLHNARFVDKSQHVDINVKANLDSTGSPAGSGIRELLANSMPDAFHDSYSRHPPPRCHHGTHRDYIKRVVEWGLGAPGYTEPILWVQGPFGVGKSALAQTCTELLESKHRLAASVFLSRSNGRDDPNRIFTSIAYQLAMQCPAFSDTIDTLIRNNPALVTKSLARQFNEFLAQPLKQIGPGGSDLEGRVIVLDGLDECEATEQQSDIIDIIANSAAQRTTPFRWFITSRPESHITQAMRTRDISPFVISIELPLYRKINHFLLSYFRDELRAIGRKHNFLDTWPSDVDLVRLVELAAGLFIHAAIIVRFIGDPNSLGPNDQLRSVLALADGAWVKTGTQHPLTEMDLFYTVIMQRVPSHISSTVRKVLLLGSVLSSAEVMWLPAIANVLGLSEEQIRIACGTLQSVLTIAGATKSMKLLFYHSSFMDFMKNPERSKGFCLYGDCLTELRRELAERLHKVNSYNIATDTDIPCIDVTFPLQHQVDDDRVFIYHRLVLALVQLWQLPNQPIDLQSAVFMKNITFQAIPRFLRNTPQTLYIKPTDLRNNLPKELRDNIHRRSMNPVHYIRKPKFAGPEPPYIFGSGKNGLVCWSKDGEIFMAEVPTRDGNGHRDTLL